MMRNTMSAAAVLLVLFVASGQLGTVHCLFLDDGNDDAVIIEYEDGRQEAFDFLFVACDPQDGLPDSVMPKSRNEERLFSKDVMTSFTFKSTLMRFPKGEKDLAINYSSPQNLDKSDGSLTGYRSETRREILYQALTVTSASNLDLTETFEMLLEDYDYEYVMLFQHLDPEVHGALDDTELFQLLDSEMQAGTYSEWFKYSWADGTMVTSLNAKYFNHFKLEALQQFHGVDHWEIQNMQGEFNTIYVHGTTSFEAIITIWHYINQLWSHRRYAFPHEKNSRIAIVGAGPSGLLAARLLARNGYTDITVLEKEPNFDDPTSFMKAGYTETLLLEEGQGQVIPNELGTCYTSVNYDAMVKDFQDTGLLDDGQESVSNDQVPNGPTARLIFTQGQFQDNGPVATLAAYNPEIVSFSEIPNLLTFDNYGILKGFEEEYANENLDGPALAKRYPSFRLVLAIKAIKYISLHHSWFGSERPFPLFEGHRKYLHSRSLYDFLADNDLLSLLGLIQYGYSAQGYGRVGPGTNIAAYYFLTWFTPDILVAYLWNEVIEIVQTEAPMLAGALGEYTPLVTTWSKGWGDIWRQLKQQFEDGSSVTIHYNVTIQSITRKGLDF